MTKSLVLTLIAIVFACAFFYTAFSLWKQHKKRIAREAEEKRQKELAEGPKVNFWEQAASATESLMKTAKKLNIIAEKNNETARKLNQINENLQLTQTYSNLPLKEKDPEIKILKKRLASGQQEKAKVLREIESNKMTILNNLERPSSGKIN